MHIAVDFGGTNIKIGLVHQGKMMRMTSVPAHSGNGLVARLSDVEISIKDLLRQLGYSLQDCTGIGLAIPGIVDSSNQRLLSINAKYSDAVGFSFKEWANAHFQLPFVMENDARAALLGEISSEGTASGESNVVLVMFGTGIGTAAIMNGDIVRGKHFQAGILGGHITSNVYGNKCNCGNIGCVEAQSSHWAMQGKAEELLGYKQSILADKPSLDYQSVVEASKAGDTFAIRLLEDLIVHWSAAILNMIHAYDPEVVVLSGGLMKSADYLLPRITSRVHELAWAPWGQVRFVVAQDPDISVLLGLSYMLENQ